MFREDFKKDLTNDKLYNWINSLINVRDVEHMMDYVTIYDLVYNTLENGRDSVTSTLVLDGVEYTFNMSLQKKDTPNGTCICKDSKQILKDAISSLNDLDCS